MLVFAMTAHEYAHAVTALRQGDDTAYLPGRVTLNPIPHIDPWMSLVLPALLWFGSNGRFTFGGAKPVPVNPRKYRDYVRGDILVSAAGGMIFLRLYGANLSVAVWVGFIALFGVADDAAVVILSFLEDAFKGKTPASVAEVRETVVEASLTRVRPLLMSTVTSVIGLLPLFLTEGRGSDVMQPMAVPSVGGIAVQVVAFLAAPCLYCLVQDWKLRRRTDNPPRGADPPVTT